MSDETKCYYVSSRGLLKSCDVFSCTPMSSIPQLINYEKNMRQQKDGSVIYVCNTAIPEFISLLPNINYRFVLVSGDSDTTVPNDIFKSNADFIKFMDSDKLIHWYSQNCIANHPKISRMPIGLDYHTLSENNYKWGPQSLPINQEKELLELKTNAKPFWERELKCYSNFHFSFYKFGQDRKDAMNQIPTNLMFYEKNEVQRNESWKKQSDYAFVISPHGNGLDCHRTWEALALGCIVIVKTSGLDPLHIGLPVLIVKEWSDVCKELLEETIQKFQRKQFNYSKLTLDYWVDKIKGSKMI